MLNTMNFYLWFLLVLGMLHEFEEIIMIEAWFGRHKEKIKITWPKRMPFGLNHAGPYLTSSIAIGILSQFIVGILICLFCAIFNNYYAWYGFNVGFVLNTLLLHVRDVIKFKGYTPGFVTGAVLFFPFIWILYQANTLLHYGALEIVLATVVVNVVGMFVVFRLLHKAMASWSKKLVQYSGAEARQ